MREYEFMKLLEHHPGLVVAPAAVFLVTLAVCWVARRLLLRALSAWTARTRSRGGEIMTEALSGPTVIWMLVLATHLAIESSDLPRVVSAVWAPRLLVALVVISFTMMMGRVTGQLVRHWGNQAQAILPVTTLTETLAQIAVIILGIVVLLGVEHVNITPLLTALGVGGLAVALALQDTLSNLFAGFYVAVSRQVRLGDYIKLSTGEEGYVVDISWRSTTIRALASNLIFVPNAKLSQANVTNYWLPDKRMGVSIQVNVALDCDVDQVERLLNEVGQQAAGQIPGLVADPPPSAFFDPGVGDFAIGFTLGYQVEEFSQQYAVRNELRKRVLRRLRAEGIRIPYPTRTLYVENLSAETQKS
ncbi:MAG: mechanosensitive ion channel family protein [Bryobacteraceae bacterium]